MDLKDVRALRVTLTKVDQPQDTDLRGNGGLREIRIPGVHVRQSLRPPLLSAQALGGRDLDHVALTYLFERTTGDEPFLRDRQTGSPLLQLARTGTTRGPDRPGGVRARRPLVRAERLGAPRGGRAPTRCSTVSPGCAAAAEFDSSGRFHNLPRYRASSAFDADPRHRLAGHLGAPVRRVPLALVHHRRPLRCRACGSWRRAGPSGARAGCASAGRGRHAGAGRGRRRHVELPRPVPARRFRLTVLDALPGRRERPRTEDAGRGHLLGRGARPGAGRFRGPGRCAPRAAACASRGGRGSPLQPRGTVEQLNAGRPFRARGCDGPVAWGRGSS